jgi:hypothetical protein
VLRVLVKVNGMSGEGLFVSRGHCFPRVKFRSLKNKIEQFFVVGNVRIVMLSHMSGFGFDGRCCCEDCFIVKRRFWRSLLPTIGREEVWIFALVFCNL